MIIGKSSLQYTILDAQLFIVHTEGEIHEKHARWQRSAFARDVCAALASGSLKNYANQVHVH